MSLSHQRERLNKELDALQKQWNLLLEILERFRTELVIETDISRKVQLEHQIQEKEVDFRKVKQKIEQLELEIQRIEECSDRHTYLQELQQESRARCIVRWLAAGVDEQTAEKFADDPNIGQPPATLQLSPGKVVLLVGMMGAGKSLIAERLCQTLITQAMQNKDAPIPYYLESWQWLEERPLQKAVETAGGRCGNPKKQGAIVIINGADEVISSISDLLTEARFLVRAWQNTTVVITSRPLRTLLEVGDIRQVSVPELTIEQICDLINQVSGQLISMYTVSQWSPSLQDAIKLPLFALLLADYLKAPRIQVPKLTGELLNSLIERSLGQEVADRESANRFLQDLAVRCTECSGLVQIAEVVTSRAELQPILKSRLVIERQGKIGFTLPIFNEWFAAKSLAAGNPDPELLIQNLDQLESWRYPLVMAIATASYDQSSRLLAPIVKSYPAFAASIVHEAIADRFIDIPPQPWQSCGQRLREAMQAWITGLGQPLQKSLSQLITPVDRNGLVRKIGVTSKSEVLLVGWYQGNEDLEDVVELPPLTQTWDFGPFKSVSRLPTHGEYTETKWLGPQPAWVWLWTLDELATSLSRFLDKRGLSMDYGLFAQEALWKLACLVLQGSRKTPHHYFPPHRAIPLDLLEAVLSEFDPNSHCFIFDGWLKIYRQDLDRLSDEIAKLRALGCNKLAPPWEEPEYHPVKDYFPWKIYTPEQIKTYAEYVYLEALNGYQYMINKWFPKFAAHLKLSVLMPVHLVGTISFATKRPNLRCHFEVLPYGAINKVSFSIIEPSKIRKKFFDPEEAIRVDNQRHALRPGKALLIGNTVFQGCEPHLFKPTSATDLVYNWLLEDLNQVFWVNPNFLP